MGVLAAYAVPHPPLIIPAVGQGNERVIQDTVSAMESISRRIGSLHPNTVVVISPHAPAYRDGFFISTAPREEGSMASFGQPQEKLSVPIDQELAQRIASLLEHHGIPATGDAAGDPSIDHGTYVPLYFLKEAGVLGDPDVVRIGLSGLSAMDHRRVGQAISQAAEQLDRSIIVIASGDWSHRLKEDGPYGFAPEGPVFDQTVAQLFDEGDLEGLFTLDPKMCEGAGECGLRSFQIMTGVLEGQAFTSELLSYEGPFGVGYGVAAFEVDQVASNSQEEAIQEGMESGWDPLVSLARSAIEAYVTDKRIIPVPSEMSKEYTKRKAGTFVSIHEKGSLRGCIGTISPQHHSIAEEVVANAIAAAIDDPRFDPITPDELPYLELSVDVLGEPEKVDSLIELDPKTYGVIVSKGWKRGLLLPDLEGVETVADQISIAKRKAGIPPDEDVKVERFQVIRHTAGGGAPHDRQG